MATVADVAVIVADVVADIAPTPCAAVLAASPWVTADGGDKPVHPNRHTGRYTGMGIEQFQNELYVWNHAGFASVGPDGVVRSVGLTDYELAVLWAIEFPGARCDYMAHVNYVASTRTDYVNGRHASANDTRRAGCNITFGVDGLPASKPYRGPARK